LVCGTRGWIQRKPEPLIIERIARQGAAERAGHPQRIGQVLLIAARIGHLRERSPGQRMNDADV
jgi:hypothetical protein